MRLVRSSTEGRHTVGNLAVVARTSGGSGGANWRLADIPLGRARRTGKTTAGTWKTTRRRAAASHRLGAGQLFAGHQALPRPRRRAHRLDSSNMRRHRIRGATQ